MKAKDNIKHSTKKDAGVNSQKSIPDSKKSKPESDKAGNDEKAGNGHDDLALSDSEEEN